MFKHRENVHKGQARCRLSATVMQTQRTLAAPALLPLKAQGSLAAARNGGTGSVLVNGAFKRGQ